jgi:hypothetical protein
MFSLARIAGVLLAAEAAVKAQRSEFIWSQSDSVVHRVAKPRLKSFIEPIV